MAVLSGWLMPKLLDRMGLLTGDRGVQPPPARTYRVNMSAERLREIERQHPGTVFDPDALLEEATRDPDFAVVQPVYEAPRPRRRVKKIKQLKDATVTKLPRLTAWERIMADDEEGACPTTTTPPEAPKKPKKKAVAKKKLPAKAKAPKKLRG